MTSDDPTEAFSLLLEALERVEDIVIALKAERDLLKEKLKRYES